MSVLTFHPLPTHASLPSPEYLQKSVVKGALVSGHVPLPGDCAFYGESHTTPARQHVCCVDNKVLDKTDTTLG